MSADFFMSTINIYEILNQHYYSNTIRPAAVMSLQIILGKDKFRELLPQIQDEDDNFVYGINYNNSIKFISKIAIIPIHW